MSVVDTVFYNGNHLGNIESDYTYLNKQKNWNLSANYIAKLDTAGSTFKLLVDYVKTHPYTGGNVDVDHILPGDTYTYRSRNESKNNLYSVAGDFNLRVGGTHELKPGLNIYLAK